MSIAPKSQIRICLLAVALFALGTVNSGWAQKNDGAEEIKKIEKELERNDDLLQRIIKLAGNKLLMDELEIVGEQSIKLRKFSIEHLNKIQQFKGKAFQLRVRELSGNLSKLEKQRLAAEKKFNTRQMAEVTNKSLAVLETILLKHQFRRLRQISLQQRLIETNQFADEFGMSLELEELQLSSAEHGKLREKIREHRDEYYRQVEKLRSATVAKILESLTDVQTQKYKDSIGDHYDFEAARRRAANWKRRNAQ